MKTMRVDALLHSLGQRTQGNAVPEDAPSHSAMNDDAVSFQIAVLYQDSISRTSAVRLCEKMKQRFGAEQVQTMSWPFRSLSNPQAFNTILEAACKAQILILAMHASEPLPETITEWLQSWIAQRHDDASALVSLFVQNENRNVTPCVTEDGLRQLAASAGLQYFSHVVRASAPAEQNSWDSQGERHGAVTSVLRGILEHTQETGERFWGLND